MTPSQKLIANLEAEEKRHNEEVNKLIHLFQQGEFDEKVEEKTKP